MWESVNIRSDPNQQLLFDNDSSKRTFREERFCPVNFPDRVYMKLS